MTSPDNHEGSQSESVRDTIESIVVALILAFVFRAFVVEAFVIPTGSMAPTLYGAHGTIVCADCGTEFAYGLKDLSETRNIIPVSASATVICPNCGYHNTHLATNDIRRNPESGDRILVFKWPYDIGGKWLGPKRWDVVVFKDPADGTTNFIKRLAGMPGETLLIWDGDVYTVPNDDLSAEAQEDLGAILTHKRELRQSDGAGRLRPPRAATRVELARKLRIARKPPDVQKSLWFTVYNHDYIPQRLDVGQPYWNPARREKSGWNATNRCVRFHDKGETSDYIELGGKPIVAECAYNVGSPPPPPVSDLRVRFVLTPLSGQATVRIRLEKHERAFWASIKMDGQVSICESEFPPDDTMPTLVSGHVAPFSIGKSVQVAFQILDYRLSLQIGDEEVLATSTDPKSASYYGPDIDELARFDVAGKEASPPRIYAEGGNLELRHLVVDRDIHYYLHAGTHALALRWAPSSGWGSPECPIMLRKGEYFMLGDNTAASKDGRLWDSWAAHLAARGEGFQLGTVPRDQLIGKAFFVYWPSPHRVEWLDWLPVLQGAVIPDVGRMRWIR